MTYEEARTFIQDSNQYGSKLGLEAITELLNKLGNPQDKLKVIHVAGTNGKGSTCAFIASILAESGYLVGRYNSPAVFEYLEMVQIDYKDNEQRVNYCMKEEGVVKAIDNIKLACEEMLLEGKPHPTSFEIETAMALLYLYREKVDIAIIEVGLGGRLDATNVFKHPLCNVITSISLDHMSYLGDTLEKIAYEKAGIIKEGAIVTTSNTDSEILDVIKKKVDQFGNHFYAADYREISDVQYLPDATSFHYKGAKYSISLHGEYQLKNAILAIETVKALAQNGFYVQGEAIEKGLLTTTWGGRFERISSSPLFIMDGAHNEDAAIQLRASVQNYYPKHRKIFIIGVLADKEYHKILEQMAELAEVIITITPCNDRALPSEELAKVARRYAKGEVLDGQSIHKAVELAYEKANKEDLILAFGSLSYLGELYNTVKKKEQVL